MSDIYGGPRSEGDIGNVDQPDRRDQDGDRPEGGGTAWPRPRPNLSEDVQVPPSMPEPGQPHAEIERARGGASVARVVAIIVSAGLAWATAVTLVAWILGRLLSH
jgi:hypothetical protein